jgi:hypothetical protein
MRADDELDLLLEAALTFYAPPEPAPALAARVLASIRQQARATRHPRRWLTWSIAAPILAALLLTTLIPARHRLKHTTASPPRTSAALAPRTSGTPGVKQRNTSQTATSATATHRRTAMQVAVNTQPLPRQEVFPTPTPLTAEEQALIALVNKNPGNVTQAVAESQTQPVEPIHIAAIQIPLINSSDKGEN